MASVENTGFGLVPEARKSRARICSFFVCVLILVIVIILSILMRSELECYERRIVNGTLTETNTRPPVVRCGKRLTKNYFSAIFQFALSVIGVVLGTLLDRLCLVAEEYWHKNSRHGGNYFKMFKACFGGIQWGAVFMVFGLALCLVIAQSLLGERSVHYGQIAIIILSGLSAGPLILHLLNLDTQSEVQISTLVEKMDKNVARGLAWSYYFGYLKIVLPQLQDEITEKDWRDKLSSQMLFILIPLDCNIFNDIRHADNQIAIEKDMVVERRQLRGGLRRPYSNQVYRITGPSNETFHILLEYASPLATLYDMSLIERINFITEAEVKNETRLFYSTLKSILDNPPGEHGCKGKCVLVTYDPNFLHENNSSLSDLLIQHLKTLSKQDGESETISQNETDFANAPLHV